MRRIKHRHRSVGNYALGSKGTPAQTASSVLRAIGIPFTLVGVLLIGICIAFIYNDSTFDEKYELVFAKIVDINSHRNSDGDKSYDVYVSYEYNGNTYERVSINVYTSSMYVGQRMEVYIDPDAPSRAHVKAGTIAGTILAVIGLIFGGAGIALIAAAGGNVKKRLVDSGLGEMVYATVTFAGDSKVTVNNMRTYRIKATWDDPTGISHDYKSELLYFDPTNYINEGELIRVYVDPKNYKKYYMCASELQSEDPEYQQYSNS